MYSVDNSHQKLSLLYCVSTLLVIYTGHVHLRNRSSTRVGTMPGDGPTRPRTSPGPCKHHPPTTTQFRTRRTNGPFHGRAEGVFLFFRFFFCFYKNIYQLVTFAELVNRRPGARRLAPGVGPSTPRGPEAWRPATRRQAAFFFLIISSLISRLIANLAV